MTDTVTVTFAADTRNVALARTLTAAMAARADLTLDRLEDARLAVDEAVSEVLASAPPGAEVTAAFTPSEGRLTVVVSAATQAQAPPSETSFGWTVLTALADVADASVIDGRLTIHVEVAQETVGA